MYTRVLVPTDGSPYSDEAIAHGVAIAGAMGSAVVFLFVMDTFGARQEGVVNIAEAQASLRVRGQAIVERATRVASEAGVRASGEVVEGDPADEIVARAVDFDLVVMGSPRKGILKRITAGSVTHSVESRIARPLLLVPLHSADGLRPPGRKRTPSVGG